MLWWAAARQAEVVATSCNLQNKAHDRQGNEGIRIAIALFGLIRHNATAINFENMLLKPLLKYQDHAYSAGRSIPM